jgi:hypothetical protein
LAEIVTLILSRGHYSIDLAGGVMLGYIAVNLTMPCRERFRLESAKRSRRSRAHSREQRRP